MENAAKVLKQCVVKVCRKIIFAIKKVKGKGKVTPLQARCGPEGG
jgi:hypothetical protein